MDVVISENLNQLSTLGFDVEYGESKHISAVDILNFMPSVLTGHSRTNQSTSADLDIEQAVNSAEKPRYLKNTMRILF